MKLKKIKNCSGMTLIELLTALTIMAIIVVAITGLMSQQLKSFATTQSQVEVQENLRGVLDDIVNDIRISSGDSIEILQDSSNGNTVGTYSQKYSSSGNNPIVSGNQLKVKGFIYRLHKTSTDNITKVYRAFTPNVTNLSNTAPLTSPELNITRLTFQGEADGSIEIIIKGVSSKENSFSYQLKTKIKPRVD